MNEKYGHFYRQKELEKKNELVRQKALSTIIKGAFRKKPTTDNQVKSLYYRIDKQLLDTFPTTTTYRLAREALLEHVREYNAKEPDFIMFEPDVPIVLNIQQPHHRYEWFVVGSDLAEKSKLMRTHWQNKSRSAFSKQDLLEGFIFSSIYYGGLNDVDALRALLSWCYSERKVNRINLAKAESLYFVHLTIESEKYGCKNAFNQVERYYTHVLDDISLAFLVAMGKKSYLQNESETLEALITSISKRLKLNTKDCNDKPQLTTLVKYANFNWSQSSSIDVALSFVLRNKRKTTALSPKQLAEYQNEKLNKHITPFDWEDVFSESYTSISTHSDKAQKGATNHQNVISDIKQCFAVSTEITVTNLKGLLEKISSENTERVICWAIDVLSKPTTKFEVAKTYLVFIAEHWIAKTQGQNVRQLTSSDYEDIYDQIIFSAPKDARSEEPLNKQSVIEQFNLSDYDLEVAEIDDVPNYLDDNKEGENSDLEDIEPDDSSLDTIDVEPHHRTTMNQFMIAERLQAFHRFMCTSTLFHTPQYDSNWQGKAQIVKANMISPNLYQQMQTCIAKSTLGEESKEMCLIILFLAYRTGLRISELAGLKVKDCIGEDRISLLVRPNIFRSLKSSSARRVIDLHALFKPEELELFKLYLATKNRLKHQYLFSLGNGSQPLKPIFYNRLMKVIWDKLLPEHNLSFHSFRHNAFSQLALVLRRSPLTYVMTDYTPVEVRKIRQGLLGYYKNKGAWEGLSAFAGHLTTDPTFEHYLHTAHFIAGEQLSQAKLSLPFLVVEQLTGISKNLIAHYDKTAYDKHTRHVKLSSIRRHMAKRINLNKHAYFTSNKVSPKYSAHHAEAPEHHKSIFLHDKSNDVIAFLQDLQQILANHLSLASEATVETQSQQQIINETIASVSFKHDIPLKTAKQLYERAANLFTDGRLLPSLPKGERNSHILNNALERAYKLSIEDPDALAQFVTIFSERYIASKSCIKFGKKAQYEPLLKTFVAIGSQLVAPQYWQISAKSKELVKELKSKLELDAKIKTGENAHLDWYEVRVVAKKNKHSDKTRVKTAQYYSSTGVLKFLSYFLMINVSY